MPPVEAKIRISSTLLREPHVFDRLGKEDQPHTTEGGLARDILLWASWKNSLLVQLNIPDFCRLLGYNRQHLLRALTPDQEKVMLRAGFKAESLDRKKPGNVNSLIAYVITVMFKETLPFADKSNTPENQKFTNKVMVREMHVFKKKKTGTCIEFTISEEVLKHSRGNYQTIDLVDYLALVTPRKEAKEGKPAREGQPDDPARKIYWHLLWKRQWWDYLESKGLLRKGDKPSESNYRELVLIAGLQNYTPVKEQAYRLRKLLARVCALPSVNMELNMRLNVSTGLYDISWKRNKLTDAGKPTEKPTPFPCELAPPTWGTDPEPPLLVARQPRPKLVQPTRKTKLHDELSDAEGSLRWLMQPATKATFEPAVYEVHLAEVRTTIASLKQRIDSLLREKATA
jgi:hypothetical protein